MPSNTQQRLEELEDAKYELKSYKDELKTHDREVKSQAVTRKEILRDIERAKKIIVKLSGKKLKG